LEQLESSAAESHLEDRSKMRREELISKEVEKGRRMRSV
jgi:hypothetical protein